MGETTKTSAMSLSTIILSFTLLGNTLANDEFRNLPSNSTERNISGAISHESFSGPVELCLTWWSLNKRFYKSCVIKDETGLLEGSGSDMMKCVNQIKDGISTSIKPTITVLKIKDDGQCESNSNMVAEVCLLLIRGGKTETYAIKIDVLPKQRYIVHIDSDIIMAHGFDLLQLSGAIALTSLNMDNCGNVVQEIKKGKSFGVSTILPTTHSSCIIQQNNGELYGEYCLEYFHVEKTVFKFEGNCSLSEHSLGLKPALSKHHCDKVKLKAFCIVENIPHIDHTDYIYTFCARPILPFEEDNITKWKIKVMKDCLDQNPIDSVTQRGCYIDTKTIDINDEDILHEENLCTIYSGDFPYTTGSKLFQYYSGMILPFFATTGIIFNIFALKGAVQQTMNGSVKVYIIAIALSNMAVAINFIIGFSIQITSYFSHIFCMIEPIIHKTFTDICLLVMLGLSVERTIAVCKPLLTKSWCTAARARKVSYSHKPNERKWELNLDNGVEITGQGRQDTCVYQYIYMYINMFKRDERYGILLHLNSSIKTCHTAKCVVLKNNKRVNKFLEIARNTHCS